VNKLMIGIQDPVNEENYIGGQTFSAREIQQEWHLSENALSAAINEYAMNINGGREQSLLASIVGLTTRYHLNVANWCREYESRKQINSRHIPNTVQPSLPHIPVLAKSKKLVSPPPELNPTPSKRFKFRNMLTSGGGLVDNEEVQMILARGKPWGPASGKLLDLGRDSNPATSAQGEDILQSKSSRSSMNVELLHFETLPRMLSAAKPGFESSRSIAATTELLSFGTGDSRPIENELDCMIQTIESTEPIQPLTIQPLTTALSSLDSGPAHIAFIASSQSYPSISTTPISLSALAPSPKYPPPPLSQTLNVAKNATQDDVRSSLLSTPPPQLTTSSNSLLDIEGPPPSFLETFDDLASLNQPYQSFALGDLEGLDFQKPLLPADPVQTGHDNIQLRSGFSDLANLCNLPNIQTSSLDPPKVETSNEAIVFQGRHSRKSTPDLQSTRQDIRVDPASLDRAFRMFSLGIKSQK
jgi:hypothetical protein